MRYLTSLTVLQVFPGWYEFQLFHGAALVAAAAMSSIKDAGLNNMLIATSAWQVVCQTDLVSLPH